MESLGLAESTCDVILGLPFRRITEHIGGNAQLDQPSHVKESGVIGTTPGLLHVVRDQHDGVSLRVAISSSTLAVAMGSSAEQGRP